jgi:hypothetical protein
MKIKMKNKRTSLFSEVTPVIKNRYYGVKNELLKPENIIKGAIAVEVIDGAVNPQPPTNLPQFTGNRIKELIIDPIFKSNENE